MRATGSQPSDSAYTRAVTSVWVQSGTESRQHGLQLRVGEAARVAVVPLLERLAAPVQQALSAHALGQRRGDLGHRPAQRAGEIVERLERQRFPVDRVAAEQLVGALAGQHDLDVLARLAGDEEQRHQRGVGDGFVEIPDDLGQRGDELGLVHHLGDVPGADRLGRGHRHVDLREALALEAGGEGDQPWVVPHRQRRDRGGVDAAGQEGADGDIGAHVLGDRVLQHRGDLVVAALFGACERRAWRRTAA